MKKGMIIGIIAAVVVIALAVTALVLCSAPEFPYEGTYVSESGLEVVISGDTLTCEAKGESAKLEKLNFDYNYFGLQQGNFKYIHFKVDGQKGWWICNNLSGEDTISDADFNEVKLLSDTYFILYNEYFFLQK